MSLLTVENLSIQAGLRGDTVVQDLSFDLSPGQMLALVGESGSGKTMVARSVLGLLPKPMRVAQGAIRFDGTNLVGLAPKPLSRYRGGKIGMVFQEPMTSLNPSMPIGKQLTEGLKLHKALPRKACREQVLAMLDRVKIPNPRACLNAYPHEFSGGMRQRLMLASVMLLQPQLLIADEPTTALDCLVQHDVLTLMTQLAAENGAAVLLISHDLGMVSRYIEDTIVLQHGKAVEAGKTAQVLTAPRSAYTKRLVDALPRRSARVPKPAHSAEPLVELRGLTVDYPSHQGLLGRTPGKRAVDEVDLIVDRGETLALVGASGSGKTTIGRAIVGLEPITAGTMLFQGRPLSPDAPDMRRDLQIVFQDPYSSLNPRQRVQAIIGEPLRLDPNLSRSDRADRVQQACADVGLDPHLQTRFPHQLSGGQRQRVAIARAIVSRPSFVVADEPVSALDMTVQKQILDLIQSLQHSYGFACLFVSHDLAVVEQIADRVAVIENGKIVETGPRDAIFDAPQADYTRRLLGAAMLLGRSFVPMPEGG